MVPIARNFTSPLLVLVLGPIACLKANPLVEQFAEEAYGDSDGGTDTDTGTDTDAGTDTEESGDPPSDMLELACEAPPELVPECGACLVDSCCTSLGPCGGDPVCVCLADCVFVGNSENECRMLCGEKPADVEPLAPLLSCASQDCPNCFEDS